jgi:ParB family chromosome partitioning protein
MAMSADAKKKRPALGMGLDALLPDSLQEELMLCPIERVRPSASQPRKVFEVGPLEELAASIREKGLIQPVVVRRIAGSKDFELIAGERRWRAAQKAGLTEIPAIVRAAGEEEVLELALIENLQRENLNPIEEARAFKLLLDTSSASQEEVAKRLGKSRAAVANALRLLALPVDAMEALYAGQITAGHARAILSAPEERRKEVLAAVMGKGLSVREAEALAARRGKARVAAKRKDPDLKMLEERLGKSLGSRVSVKTGRRKGTGVIAIRYENYDDLDRLLALLEKNR